MTFTGNNSIKNYVFDGAYDVFLAPIDTGLSGFWHSNDLNPNGITGTFVYYSDGDSSIDSGYLGSGYSFGFSYVSGAGSSASSQSGYIYYNVSTPIFGACHGFGKDENVWHNGYNFYNAFHPEGYILPPYGQNISIFKSNDDGKDALAEDGSCASLTQLEYDDLFGIVSRTDNNINDSTDDLQTGSNSFINSPAIACPQDLSVVYYWNEVQYKLIGGTAASIGGNTFFNTNPIPTALDMFDLRVDNRYKSHSSGLGTYVSNGAGGKVEQKLVTIEYTGGKPIPAYGNTSSNQNNKLNNSMCFATVAESNVSAGIIPESLLLNAPDVLNQPSVSYFELNAWWHTYHFLFKENSDGFPFTNDYAAQDGANFGVAKTANSANYGSQLFNYTLSSSDQYWENRQCPNVVDFLPYTFGGAIYACPSYHFDVPYYAALNKFGFYGTRFLNGCVSLDLNYSLSGDSVNHPNAVDLPINYTYITPDEPEPENDKGISYSYSQYDNLLKIASLEENSSDFYALNKSLFFWANSGLIFNDSDYQYLTGKYANFHNVFVNCFGDLSAYFPSGRSGILNDSSWLISGDNFDIYDTGLAYYSLSNNENYKNFSNNLPKIISGSDAAIWKNLESKYGYAFLSSINQPDTGFYYALQSGRNQRFQTRYLENYIHGNPIDLYPTNKILFGFDQAKNYIESPDWGKKISTFGKNSTFTDTGLNRRYFLGAYLDGEDVTGITNFAGIIANTVKNSSFYPGYFNSPSKIEIPRTNYIPVITGNIYSGNQSVTNQSITNGQNPLPYGWLALGYNEIGHLQNNFSCFTPIFVQQPLETVHCKIGQSPTFRCYAVDYHTIPEDKMNNRYPEIAYWMKKLKISNGDKDINAASTNKYPLSYKWYRIKKSDCNNDFGKFLTTGYFAINNSGDIYHSVYGSSKVIPSNPTGDWCCLEGDGPICTLIHPTKCDPVFTPNNSWSYKYISNPLFQSSYQDAKRNNFYMNFKKGASNIGGSDINIHGSSASSDDQYYYFCMAQGRFGVRISEPSELFIDTNLQFDVSIQNGGNKSLSIPISFDDGNGNSVTVTASGSKYQGFSRDDDFIPENVIEMQIPPPNRGYGDVYSYKFVGTWGYGGALQTYTPGTLNDTRGLKETWGRVLHYGSLSRYKVNLTQGMGDAIYGQIHYPQCSNGDYASNRKKGIKANIGGVVHWANMQNAIIYDGGTAGSSAGYAVRWDALGNAGEMYNCASAAVNGGIDESVSPGLGQWQWGNNLGTIHRFGYKSSQGDLTQTPHQLSPQDFQKLKDKLLKNVPAGDCGWNKYGLGRNMAYWIEGFNAFYIYCDPLKKKNVTNYNYMGPGLRQTNSSIQYFWLGKPENGYLSRYPMFGPYAYQWKYNKHNRDRNGNGMSEGFYSYGWDNNYSLMYDTPAIYGLFKKYSKSQRDFPTINAARQAIFNTDLSSVKHTRFGFTLGDGGVRRYGNIWIGNKDDESTPNPTRDYVNSGESFARNPELYLYGCKDDDLENGDCFDPCISIRYANGFLPGGKYQNAASASPTGNGYRMVANNPVINNSIIEETYPISGVFFRGPFGTPHHKYLQSIGKSLNGFSPCFDGGADHCNYITPTINIGTSNYYEHGLPHFYDAVNQATASTNYPYPP